MDERAAVERLKRGDIGGLELLVRRYHTRAARAAYLIVRDRASAEDVAQGAFVRANERIGQFDADRPFGPWFIKIVVNDAVEAGRRREQTTSYEERDGGHFAAQLPEAEAGPQELAEAAETSRKVWTALKKLPPAQRAAVVQRYYLGRSETEMAEGGPSPPGTIKSRLNAARKTLSKLLHPRFSAQVAPVSLEHSAQIEASEGGNDRG